MLVRTPLGRVRGLGAGREGLHHWKIQRLTAIGNVPLVLWFMFSAWALAGSDHQAVREWLASPLSASLMILLIVSVFYHSRLGLQVVVEDYLHQEGIKIATMIALPLAITALGVASVVAVLKITLGG